MSEYELGYQRGIEVGGEKHAERIAALEADLAAARAAQSEQQAVMDLTAEIDAARLVLEIEGFEGTLIEMIEECNSQRRHALMAITELSGDASDARTAAHAWKRAAKFWYFAQPDDDGEWERWQEYRYRRELFKPVTLED